jgi:hypothetical protein
MLSECGEIGHCGRMPFALGNDNGETAFGAAWVC